MEDALAEDEAEVKGENLLRIAQGPEGTKFLAMCSDYQQCLKRRNKFFDKLELAPEEKTSRSKTQIKQLHDIWNMSLVTQTVQIAPELLLAGLRVFPQ